MQYEYEIFLSYRREDPVRNWVLRHFHPRLLQWLGESFGEEPRVFIDETIEVGTKWPEQLKSALRSSSLLVPIWSPRYFRSPWCLAEWRTMEAREQLMGIKGVNGLVCPVRYHDGNFFPLDAKGREWLDLSDLNYDIEAFERSEKYLLFIDRIKDFVKQLANRLATVPGWEPDWPIVEPPPSGAPPPFGRPGL